MGDQVLFRSKGANFIEGTILKRVEGMRLRIETTEVGLKATTNEKIGDLGRSIGIAAHAVVLLEKA